MAVRSTLLSLACCAAWTLAAPASPVHAFQVPADERATASGAGPVAGGALVRRYAALPRAEREHLQRMLMWAGDYGGRIDAAIGRNSLDAVRRYRLRTGSKEEGLLTADELARLGEEADRAFAAADFTLGTDTDAGVSFGMPYAHVRWREKTESGNLYSDDDSRFRVTSFRIEGVDGSNIDSFAASVFEDVPGYASSVREVRPDALKVVGADRYENLVLFARRRDGEIRGFFVWFDRALAPTHDRYVAAMIDSLRWDDEADEGPAVSGLEPRSRGGATSPAMPGADEPRAGEPGVAGPEIAGPEIAGPETVGPEYAGLEAPDGPASRARIEPHAGTDGPDEEPESFGSAFAIREDGRLVTNAHVVRECGRVEVRPFGKAVVQSTDDDLDLALLSIPGVRGLRAAPLADDDAVLAEDVFAFGFPLPNTLGEELGFSRGSVSSEVGLRAEKRQFRMTAAVQPGNSGGPLLDGEGRVVGIVTSKLNAMRIAQETGDIPQGMNFAVKASTLRDYLKRSDLTVPLVARTERMRRTPILAQEARHFTYQVLCYTK